MGCRTCSPQRSASSTCGPVNSRGSGTRASSARRMAVEPWIFSPSSKRMPGTVRSPKASFMTSGWLAASSSTFL